MENQPISLVFTVYIKDKPFDVYNIPGKEHPGYNDTVKTWWLYYSDRLPDGVVPPVDSEHFTPFQKSVERECWDIRFVQRNYVKYKWDNADFRSSTLVEMHCNGKRVYEFSTWSGQKGMAYAMSKVQYLMVQMSEHVYNFFDPETERGRKIYYYGLPALVSPHTDGWQISIVPDYTVGLSREEWWAEYARRKSKLPAPTKSEAIEELSDEQEDRNEDMMYDRINWGDALSDKYIDWFRS
jgi:hypothetical protein